MREILFRGKTEYKSRWVEGFYYLKKGKYAECNDIIYEHHTITTGINEAYGSYGEHSEDIEDYVFPETVGQYTGLTDKNGKKIFEGDILSYEYGDLKKRGVVFYYDKGAKFGIKENDGHNNLSLLHDTQVKAWNIKIIGNIHDNPELLKGGTE